MVALVAALVVALVVANTAIGVVGHASSASGSASGVGNAEQVASVVGHVEQSSSSVVVAVSVLGALETDNAICCNDSCCRNCPPPFQHLKINLTTTLPIGGQTPIGGVVLENVGIGRLRTPKPSFHGIEFPKFSGVPSEYQAYELLVLNLNMQTR